MRPTVLLPILTLFSLTWSSQAAPTFNADIAPLIHQNCTTCHRPGEAGPFDLITYEDVRKKSRTIERVMKSRYMPPWKPSGGDFDFQHNRRLTDAEIALFAAWVEADRPEGEGSAPEPPEFPEGWQLGPPDLVVSMDDAFPVPAEGADVYRNFALPLGLTEDKWVKAIELRPSAREVVHHSLFFVDESGTAHEMNGQDGQPGFRGMAGIRRASSLGGYVPGAQPHLLPEDLALPLAAGSDLILSTHFHPVGKAMEEQTTVGIYFAEEPPKREIVNLQVPPAFGRGMGIDVPAGESHYLVEDEFIIPVEVDAWKVSGHAHYICEEMKMTAVLPDGETRTLLEIGDWDLNWQDDYFFAESVRLPAGTVIQTELRYDNSAENPDNPFHPPQRIAWGRESTDEMGSITLMVTPAENAELVQLKQASRRKNAEVLTAALRNSRGGVAQNMVNRIQQLDFNGNGSIEESEIPQRFRDRVLGNFDQDGNRAIDSEELKDLLNAIRNRNTPEA